MRPSRTRRTDEMFVVFGASPFAKQSSCGGHERVSVSNPSTAFRRRERNKPARMCGVSLAFCLAATLFSSAWTYGQSVELRYLAQDPYGYPRPASGQTNVPLLTSYFFELAVADQTDTIEPSSVTMALKPVGQAEFYVLQLRRQFQPGYSGTLIATTDAWSNVKILAINVDSTVSLLPSTTYTITLTARSRKGATFSGGQTAWNFVTEAATTTHSVTYSLDLATTSTHWTGAFFAGFCKPSFCTSELWGRIPGYELMDQVRRSAPKAWSVQRDWWITGMQFQPQFLEPVLPNVVRERETRRIAAMETVGSNVRLSVGDFFGHEQYGIPSTRTLSPDYHPGDVVLIADGVNDALTTVVSVDDTARTVLLKNFPTPADGWKIAYSGTLPTQEDSRTPGMFPPGGCYLRKFNPPGTPHYYWGRVDKEEDIVHGQFNRRIHVNFCDGPGDLAIDGRSFTTAKDYAEYHEVVRAITSHLIERYGDACLDFVWSIGNEPDLGPLFWRTSWDELQKFYDYSVDGILRAFEEHGYDSSLVFIGGLELASVRYFGAARYPVFLAHCSPTATYTGALPQNAAYTDARLDGKRSQRVESLCQAHGGKGTPLDFISVHCYKSSSNMAGDMAYAKQHALEIDAEYYGNLWINSHESCPNWAPPPDVAANDSYLGNGYFPTWCADVERRQLLQAGQDSRYGFGETILTFWPWPNGNFSGLDDATQVLSVDSNGDDHEDYRVTVASPIMPFLGLTATMGDDYWVLPERAIGGHVVSGFASRGADDLRILLYSHEELDTQSRSGHVFRISTTVSGLGWPQAHVQEYRFDKTYNSYYYLAKELRAEHPGICTPEEVSTVQDLSALHLTGSDVQMPTGEDFTFTADVSANGANFLLITRDAPTPTPTATVTPTPTPTIYPASVQARYWDLYQ